MRSMVEGSARLYPSTTLRVVPLPMLRMGRISSAQPIQIPVAEAARDDDQRTGQASGHGPREMRDEWPRPAFRRGAEQAMLILKALQGQ